MIYLDGCQGVRGSGVAAVRDSRIKHSDPSIPKSPACHLKPNALHVCSGQVHGAADAESGGGMRE